MRWPQVLCWPTPEEGHCVADRTVLVGPEGGWDDEERMAADSVVLGENVLRAETAAIVAGSSMAQLRLGLR